MLEVDEFLYLLTLSIGVIGIPVALVFNRNYYAIFTPLTMVCIVYFYYCIIGPLYSLSKGEIIVRTFNLRDYYIPAIQGSVVSFYSLLLGYFSKKKLKSKTFSINFINTSKEIRNIGFGVIGISLILFSIFAGGDLTSRINFLDTTKTTEDFTGSFANYLMLSVNFLVVGVVLIFYYYYNKNLILIFLIVFGIVFSLFINEAFRYRLVILILSLFIAYHLYRQKKPNYLLLFSVLIPFLILMGILEVARQYGRGIDITRIQGAQYTELAEKSFNETDVFWASGLFLERVNEKYDYTYFAFITNAIAAPIPRVLWPNKPDGSYILQVNDELFEGFGKGQAFLNFCEYYLAFGWIGIVIISFLWGYFFKTIWLWYLNNKEHPLAITAIAVFNAFIYVIISRNYFTQHLTLFFFTVFPAFFVIWLYKKRFLKPKFYVRR